MVFLQAVVIQLPTTNITYYTATNFKQWQKRKTGFHTFTVVDNYDCYPSSLTYCCCEGEKVGPKLNQVKNLTKNDCCCCLLTGFSSSSNHMTIYHTVSILTTLFGFPIPPCLSSCYIYHMRNFIMSTCQGEKDLPSTQASGKLMIATHLTLMVS